MSCVCVIFLSLFALSHAQLDNVNTGIGRLSMRLLQNDVKNDKNTIHSAYSISSALGMCLLGAEAMTFQSMQDTMGFTGMTKDDIAEGFNASTYKVGLAQSDPKLGFVINKANRIYVNSTFPLGNAYKDEVRSVFRADVRTVNFREEVVVQNEINDFVKNETRDLIPKILDSPLDQSTVMALVNALYFKGSWKPPMKNSTSSKVFNSPYCSTSTNPVPATKWADIEANLNYANSSDLEATIVELPYEKNSNSDDHASMIILLPYTKHNCNISEWVKNVLTWDKIVAGINSMISELVHVTIPRMDVEASFELSEALKLLGMSEAFSDSANFNGMVDTGNASIKIDKVIHKAKMSVDEKGTEAAAATVVTMVFVSTSVRDPPIPTEMFVDRSFAAFIVLRQSSSIVPLFSAIVNQV